MSEYAMMNNGVCSLYVAVTALLCTVTLSVQAIAAEVDNLQVLLEKARNKGEVKVIVTLRPPPSLPARNAMSPQAFDRALKQAVSTAQSAVLNSLPAGAVIGPPKLFPFTAQIGVTVSPNSLAALMNNPAVDSIAEDIPDPPVLDQSVPKIFPSHATSPYSGAGWAIGILDTGVDKNHSFLLSKVMSEACYSTTNPSEFSTSVCPGGVPSSTAPDSGLPCPASTDGCDHGTHVAGIAAGNGSSFDGVAPDGEIIALQVFSQFTDPVCANIGKPSPCALTWVSDQILALQRVYELRTSFAIASANMSLGGNRFFAFCDTDSRKPSIDLLKGAGIATVIASGNAGWTDSVSAPGCISTAITVGSSTLSDVRSSFSNSGPQLDLYAPGESILSSVPGGEFASFTGTSMATPHVAGAWAVMRQKYPARTVDDIEVAFKGTGVTITASGISAQRINVDQALAFYDPATVTGQVLRIQDSGCGSYVAVASTNCPVAANLPNCNDVLAGAYCEGDGECGTNNNLNNCNPGSWDIYIRTAW